jgi:ABC-type Fe3+/spermidine/putrescine transport system ATPase subunit
MVVTDEGERTGYIEVEDLVVRYGDVVAVDGVSFAVRRGEHLTLLGPSGCGKTTTLRAIAGLESPTSGEIRIDGRPVFSSARRINLPPEQRDLSMVFQSYAIWPHMTVADNVAYGLQLRKVPRDAARRRVDEVLEMVRLGGLGDRPAARLSGGQQQRVALARSIAFHPKALLLDEPLSNLDAKLRAQMRVELRELQQQIDVTSIYVTHDQEEALAISDRIIVMNGGKIEQVGTPADIYDRPRSRFVADFIGASNIVLGRVDPSASNGLVALETEPGGAVVHCSRPAHPLGGAAAVSIRTVYPELLREQPAESTNVWPGRVVRRVFLGDSVQYFVEWAGGTLSVRKLPTALFDEGERVFVRVDPAHCVFVE